MWFFVVNHQRNPKYFLDPRPAAWWRVPDYPICESLLSHADTKTKTNINISMKIKSKTNVTIPSRRTVLTRLPFWPVSRAPLTTLHSAAPTYISRWIRRLLAVQVRHLRNVRGVLGAGGDVGAMRRGRVDGLDLLRGRPRVRRHGHKHLLLSGNDGWLPPVLLNLELSRLVLFACVVANSVGCAPFRPKECARGSQEAALDLVACK